MASFRAQSIWPCKEPPGDRLGNKAGLETAENRNIRAPLEIELLSSSLNLVTRLTELYLMYKLQNDDPLLKQAILNACGELYVKPHKFLTSA